MQYRIGYRLAEYSEGRRVADTHHVATIGADSEESARAEFRRLFRSSAPLRQCEIEWVEWVDRPSIA